MIEYKDSDSNAISLYRLINKEPEWAVNIIEKLQAENKELKERDWEKCCQEFKETLIAENKAIKKLDKKHRKLLKDHIEINDLLMAENKILRKDK